VRASCAALEITHTSATSYLSTVLAPLIEAAEVISWGNVDYSCLKSLNAQIGFLFFSETRSTIGLRERNIPLG
jgi:hypothetical protein